MGTSNQRPMWYEPPVEHEAKVYEVLNENVAKVIVDMIMEAQKNLSYYVLNATTEYELLLALAEASFQKRDRSKETDEAVEEIRKKFDYDIHGLCLLCYGKEGEIIMAVARKLRRFHWRRFPNASIQVTEFK